MEGGTDSHKRGKVTVKFGELILSSDFDSGTESSYDRPYWQSHTTFKRLYFS